jgi:hypothetical protein
MARFGVEKRLATIRFQERKKRRREENDVGEGGRPYWCRFSKLTLLFFSGPGIGEIDERGMAVVATHGWVKASDE